MSSLEKPSVFLCFYLMLKFSLQLRLNWAKRLEETRDFSERVLFAVWRKLFCTTPSFFSCSCKTFMKKLFPNTRCTYLNLYACVLSSFVKGAVVFFSASFYFTFRLWTVIDWLPLWRNLRRLNQVCKCSWNFSRQTPSMFQIVKVLFFGGRGVRRVQRPIFKKTQLVGGLLASVMS